VDIGALFQNCSIANDENNFGAQGSKTMYENAFNKIERDLSAEEDVDRIDFKLIEDAKFRSAKLVEFLSRQRDEYESRIKRL
jgi:hypothetical protein